VRGMKVGAIAARGIALGFLLGAAWQAIAQDAKTPYPNMAPIDQYLMENQGSEIALARSAAPESISRDAEVMVLGRHGYETAVQGKNGFVCMVERSWTAPIDDPGFWNPKGRAPICLNAAAARSYLPRTIKKTDLVLSGRSKAQMIEAVAAAIDKNELPVMEPGAMCYMLSKQGYLRQPAQAGQTKSALRFCRGSTGKPRHRPDFPALRGPARVLLSPAACGRQNRSSPPV